MKEKGLKCSIVLCLCVFTLCAFQGSVCVCGSHDAVGHMETALYYANLFL